eukprot:365270-Chlamydomonas_euryale.AAC.7
MSPSLQPSGTAVATFQEPSSAVLPTRPTVSPKRTRQGILTSSLALGWPTVAQRTVKQRREGRMAAAGTRASRIVEGIGERVWPTEPRSREIHAEGNASSMQWTLARKARRN